LGIEIPLAHSIVDRMLGFDRPFAESRLQLTPVEWGVWSFLVLRALDRLDPSASQAQANRPADPMLAEPGGLTLDRVGPDPFDPTGLGSIVTIRWPIRAGNVAAAVRLWLPEPIVQLWLSSPPAPSTAQADTRARADAAGPRGGQSGAVARGELASNWRAVAGSIAMPQGLRRLRAGGVVPLVDSRLSGSPRSPSGQVDLIVDLDDRHLRFRIPTHPVDDTGGRLLCVEAGLLREHRPRDSIVAPITARSSMSQSSEPQNPPPPAPPGIAALDVPVTLTVELGRVNLTLAQLAELKPGDVVELGRHSRAPVELTSNGRLVARGELVSIDADLGVRVINVFL
jgi:type III secretion system YscQ/HrcQ family protein